MSVGNFSARKLKKDRNHFRWKNAKYKNKKLRMWKRKLLRGAPQANGIVIEKKAVEQKQPHSGLIKAVRVQLIKNNGKVTAFLPGTNAIAQVNEHDNVTIEGIGGSQGGTIGSMCGIKYKVIKVNNVSLDAILKGKKKRETK